MLVNVSVCDNPICRNINITVDVKPDEIKEFTITLNEDDHDLDTRIKLSQTPATLLVQVCNIVIVYMILNVLNCLAANRSPLISPRLL